jgi:DNA-binding transcriptional regulator LsrR (DeoR family)
MTGFNDRDPRAARQLLAEVARLYYLRDVPKVEIARHLGLSRFKVARLLDQARQQGVVSITIQGAAPVDAALSDRLSQHWGLRATVVNAGDGAEAEVRRRVGQATAELFMDTAQAGQTVGLAWGRTLTAMTDYLTRLPTVSVVQLIGAGTADLNESPVELVRRTCLSTGGQAYPIIAPAMVGDARGLAALKSNPDVRAAVTLFDSLDIAFIAIGSWDPPASQIRPALAPADQQRLDQLGVCAEVAGMFFDADGAVVAEDFSQRYLSISPAQLRRVPRLFAAAGGRVKLRAVAAVVKSGLITDLVTDHSLAEAALTLAPIRPAPNPERRRP